MQFSLIKNFDQVLKLRRTVNLLFLLVVGGLINTVYAADSKNDVSVGVNFLQGRIIESAEDTINGSMTLRVDYKRYSYLNSWLMYGPTLNIGFGSDSYLNQAGVFTSIDIPFFKVSKKTASRFILSSGVEFYKRPYSSNGNKFINREIYYKEGVTAYVSPAGQYLHRHGKNYWFLEFGLNISEGIWTSPDIVDNKLSIIISGENENGTLLRRI